MPNFDQFLQQVPDSQREAAKKALPGIVSALDKEGILTPKVLAYALSTVQHESGFEPKEETLASRGVNARNDYIASLQDNYRGGKAYRGRGYIQLTHQGNYEKFGKRIGEDLAGKPEKLLDPEISAKVLAAYFKDNGVAQAVEQGDYDKARVLVQGPLATSPEFIGNTRQIGQQAQQFEKIAPELMKTEVAAPTATQSAQIPSILKSLGSETPTSSAQIQPSPAVTPAPVAPPTPTAPPVNPLSQGERPYRTPAGGLFQTQGFGANKQFYSGTGLTEGHEGIDYRMDKGTNVYSPTSGEVVYVGSVKDPRFANTYGNFAVIRTPNNEALQLAHFDQLDVKPGDQVKEGTLIGKSGATGAVVGGKEQPHLHASFSRNADQVIDNIKTFEQTGRHKYPNAGFEDPRQTFNDDYTRKFVEPKNLTPEAKTISQPEVATQSAGVTKPVQRTLQQPLQVALPQPFQPPASSPQALAARSFQPQSQTTGLSEGMKNPLSFGVTPQVELPQRLQLNTQKEESNLPAPAFNIGSKPETRTSTAQPFSPGFSQQIGGLTKSFADIVKQSFQTPQTPQQQEQKQDQTQTQPQNQTPQTNYNQAQLAAQKAREAQVAKQQSMQGVGGQTASVAPKPAMASVTRPATQSAVKIASPIVRAAQPQTYTVKKGDTLWGIAQKTMGSGAAYKKLGYTGSPTKLAVGTKLNIPRPR